MRIGWVSVPIDDLVPDDEAYEWGRYRAVNHVAAYDVGELGEGPPHKKPTTQPHVYAWVWPTWKETP